MDAFCENDTLYHRFVFGNPSKSSADWGWLQHILASLNDTGRAAVVLDTGRRVARLGRQAVEQGAARSARRSSRATWSRA